MKAKATITILAIAALILATPIMTLGAPGGIPGPPNNGESAGNNLSYPVIWAEGVTKVLPGMPEMIPIRTGEWWYQWGTNGEDPDVTPASCLPDPDNEEYCDDNISGQVNENLVPGDPPAYNPLPLAKAYLQKDPGNTWQAGSVDWSEAPVDVNWIDWGDNLESVDWYTRSQVRTEVVLFQDLVTTMLEYEMRHTSGWGIDEVHGLATNMEGTVFNGPGTRATVYSYCARFTIQKLLVDRDDPVLENLIWVPAEGWTEGEGYEGDPIINQPIFNKAVYEGGDGPGYYSAEINVKGRIIYGYTWNVRQLNDLTGTPPTAAGDYRLTFSFDEECGTAFLNTFFTEDITQIIVPAEEVIAAIVAEAEEEPGGGGTAVLDYANNLTYMDIRILERGGGGGGGGNGIGNNAGGNGNGNGPRKP